MSFTVSFKAKRFFFDRQIVADALTRAERKNLSKIGAFIRKGARSSLRRRKKVSAPGQPPSVHTTDSVATLKNIQFHYDPQRHSVVVGPIGLNQRGGAVPGILEHGGEAHLTEVRMGRDWLPTGARAAKMFRRRGQPVRRRRIKIAARPFMRPAALKELPKFPAFWANSVK